MNFVILQALSNETYLQNRLRTLSLVLWNLFLEEPILKIGSLKLFSKPIFGYRKMLKFRGLLCAYISVCSVCVSVSVYMFMCEVCVRVCVCAIRFTTFRVTTGNMSLF